MNRLQKIAGTLCLAFATATGPLTATAAQAHHTQTFQSKYATMVIDADTGQTLSAHDANKPVHPASLTKVVTLMLLFDEMDKGNIKLDDEITISQHAANAVPVKLGLSPGSKIKVRDAIQIICVKSANDIARAVAEKIGGTEDNFAAMMTQKAHQLGATNTTFVNATGLPDPQQITTASDMIKLGMALVDDYANYYHYFSEDHFTYGGITYKNTNRLMQSYKGMDGIKTGYINASGFNLLTSVHRNGHRIVAVIFGGQSSKDRNSRMTLLLNSAFAQLQQQDKQQTAVARHDMPPPAQRPDIS